MGERKRERKRGRFAIHSEKDNMRRGFRDHRVVHVRAA